MYICVCLNVYKYFLTSPFPLRSPIVSNGNGKDQFCCFLCFGRSRRRNKTCIVFILFLLFSSFFVSPPEHMTVDFTAVNAIRTFSQTKVRACDKQLPDPTVTSFGPLLVLPSFLLLFLLFFDLKSIKMCVLNHFISIPINISL